MSTNSILLKLSAAADILGGEVFFTDEHGRDTQYNNDGLIPESMYIRLIGSDDSIAYISAKVINEVLQTIDDKTKDKASNSDLNALSLLLASKASYTDLQLAQADTQADINTKASINDLRSLANTVNAKADQTTVDALTESLQDIINDEIFNSLKETIEQKADTEIVNRLISTINNVNDSTNTNTSKITSILLDIKALQDAVSTISDVESINAINKQIAYLKNKLNTQELSLDTLNSNIDTNKHNIEDIQAKLDIVEVNVNKKASSTYVQGKVSELNNAIIDLEQKVESKIDKNEVINKVDRNDFESLTTKVASMITSIKSLDSDLNNTIISTSNNLDKKANTADVTRSINTINSVLSNKADKSEINNNINNINLSLNELKTNQVEDYNELLNELKLLECELNNAINNLQANINTNRTNLNKNSTDINNLLEVTAEHTKQLKQPWVRVLSTREYNSLIPIRNNISTGYSSYYKYPNILYFVVDFNRPKAIYIGDILIAKAEQKGSVGFAYTFPISF